MEHPDGYVEIKDRLKDIIISGGENIASIEVEAALMRHPAVALAAVVARPDEKWGETPCAFVQLQPGAELGEAELIAFARDHLPHFAAPRTVIFGPLPTTATGKIQKFELRARARPSDQNRPTSSPPPGRTLSNAASESAARPGSAGAR